MQVEFVSGKGGVGKSAVAAAIARIHASRGERVLAIAMAPGGGLGPHLGLDHLTTAPVRGDEGVHALEVRRVEALEQYVRIYSPVPLLAQLGRGLRAFDALATAAPGVRELITVGKILYDAREWDRV
ncbi:MAG: anion-transporting ATPase, partial [Acidimicrobiia bacterium]